MDDVSIEYSSHRGLGDEARTTQRLLLDWLREGSRGISVQPRTEPVSRVLVGDEEVWSVPDGERVDPVAAVNAVQRYLA